MNNQHKYPIILSGTVVRIEIASKQTDIVVHNAQCTATIKLTQSSSSKSISDDSLIRLFAASTKMQDRLQDFQPGDRIRAAVDICDEYSLLFFRCPRCRYHMAYQREGVLQMKDLEPAGDDEDLNIVDGTFIVRTDPVPEEKEHDFTTNIFLANEVAKGKEKSESGLIWISNRVYKGSADNMSEIRKNNLVKIKGSVVLKTVQMRKCCHYCFHTFKKSITVTEIAALEVNRI